ncbi:hypothetical protein SAMN06265373_107203 [Shimia sagamensis]|uniref:Uncharacterized protein n=2 Tax=Shimia sagamensis TaxID=1566352 RepID=A0ABY1PCC6_9RHOB|nr:hypothetical protein SAMN06265373_107203 [Shimia sagamensis]
MNFLRRSFLSLVGASAFLTLLTPAVSANDQTFEVSGDFTPTCSLGFSGKPAAEGISFRFDTMLQLGLLLGEPVVRSSLTWQRSGFGSTCIKPYGQDGFVRLSDPGRYDPDNRSHPFDVDLVAEIVAPSISSHSIYLPFNPGALSSKAGEPGYNTSGSPNWDTLFFKMPITSYDFWKTDTYEYLTSEDAKTVLSNGFEVVQVHVVNADFDLTDLKSNYGAQTDTAAALAKVANRLADWGQETFANYPPGVHDRIVEGLRQKTPDNIAALRGTIDDIQALHKQLLNRSNDAAIAAEIAEQTKGLNAFLKAIDAPLENEEFWQLLTHSSTISAQAEREQIAIRRAEITSSDDKTTDEAALELGASTPQDTPPFDLKNVVGKLKYALGGIAVDYYEIDCGKASFRMPDVDSDETTGVLTLNVLQHVPMCGNGSDINRNSIFEFSVLDIASYELTDEKLVINFAGQTLSENYYTSASYPDRFQESSSQLVLLINPEEDYKLGEAEKALRSIISGR